MLYRASSMWGFIKGETVFKLSNRNWEVSNKNILSTFRACPYERWRNRVKRNCCITAIWWKQSKLWLHMDQIYTCMCKGLRATYFFYDFGAMLGFSSLYVSIYFWAITDLQTPTASNSKQEIPRHHVQEIPLSRRKSAVVLLITLWTEGCLEQILTYTLYT